jgi:hypothetical protein
MLIDEDGGVGERKETVNREDQRMEGLEELELDAMRRDYTQYIKTTQKSKKSKKNQVGRARQSAR